MVKVKRLVPVKDSDPESALSATAVSHLSSAKASELAVGIGEFSPSPLGSSVANAGSGEEKGSL